MLFNLLDIKKLQVFKKIIYIIYRLRILEDTFCIEIQNAFWKRKTAMACKVQIKPIKNNPLSAKLKAKKNGLNNNSHVLKTKQTKINKNN